VPELCKYHHVDYTTCELAAKFDVLMLRTFNPVNFKDFGVMDSKIYAGKLFRFMDEAKLSTTEKMILITKSTAVKN
jgi:hypothetical protein